MTSTHLQQHQHRSVLHAAAGGSPRMHRPHPYHAAAGPFPRHFLVRPATTKHTASGTITTPGPMVPLIAVDQLPEWIDIAGVPRELTVEQTMGLQNLGSVVVPGEAAEYYEVRLHQDVRFVKSSSSSSHSALKRRESSKNNSSSLLMDPDAASLAPSETDLLGSGSSSQHAHRKQSDLVTVVNGTSGHHSSNMNNPDDSTSSALNSSSETSYSSSSTEPATSHTRSKKPPTKKGKEKASKTETTAANSSKGLQGNTTTIKPPEPLPPHHHPASRLLSAIAPTPLYSPAHPQQQQQQTAPNPHSPHDPHNPNSKSSSQRHQRAIVHCRHWCHHGSCKYGPDCRYEHEMPRTHERLREVGLADWPNWYKAAIQMAFDMRKKKKKTSSSAHRSSKGGSMRASRAVAVAIVKTVVVEERLGRLASIESGGSDGDSSGAKHGDPELSVQPTPVLKKQNVAENITAPVENLVDI
ncbi:uncharacterized protein PG986_008116 [Apiospora aurea]|uniref:C3H1-type domain-containing protein n=1 Tax=Apiospora aurea TaxID=335848 RepID=A0ABR1QEH4_9PEZI